MENKLSTFREFESKDEADRAVREICAAGFENVKTCNLTPNLGFNSDVGLGPQKKIWRYVAIGFFLGAFLGATVGALVFWIPASSVDIPYAHLLSLIGTLICTVTGAIVLGFGFFVLSKRTSADPTSSLRRTTIGVQVWTETTRQLKIAKQILGHFEPHHV